MNIWLLLALLVILFLVWLVVTRPSAPAAATTLGGEMIGPSLQERNARQAGH